MGDYCDSPAFRSHPLFSNDPSALQIMLYYDDVEVTNPLGSKTKTHKLGNVCLIGMLGDNGLFMYTALFYYSLGNISPQYRSMLWNIQLLAVARSPTLQKYGPDRILEPIMKDIKVLEQVLWLLSLYMYDNNFLLKAGVDVTVEGVEHNLKGTVTFVPGDNLASQCLGGYKSLSSALRKCRHCLAVNEGMQTKVSIEYMKW